MSVVATGMHDAWHFGGIAGLILLLDWESIHVGTQRDNWPFHPHVAHNASFADTRIDRYAKGLQSICHKSRRPMLAKAQLGMAMDSTAEFAEFGRKLACAL
jgi:hypothetical protein